VQLLFPFVGNNTPYTEIHKTAPMGFVGGDKRAQAKDIEKAHGYWKDYKTHKAAVSSGGSPKKPV
jgi:hypothetical protein